MIGTQFDLTGRVALMTGGSKGLGKAMARGFAEAGADIVIASRSESELKAAAEAIGSKTRVAWVVADLSRREEAMRLAIEAQAAFGRIDILVNNAMDASMSPLEELTLEAWHNAFRVNVDAALVSTQEVSAIMKRNGGGAIVNTISICAIRSVSAAAAYSASKAALLQFSNVAAIELAPWNIRVNTMAPGTLVTPALHQSTGSDPAIEGHMARTIPMGRLGRAEDGANAILYLASDEAAYVTGVCISVDGGKAIQCYTADSHPMHGHG
jgi:meso-butanediol dehydrogenase / (S,S)-butanediol dehydrogenase / diacetyl reductase